MKRKKRLKKGIESIQEQIEFHKQKREKAMQEGEEELARYYAKEIESLENSKDKKEEILDKQQLSIS